MWVRLKSTMHIDRQGKLHTYHPGDWVDVGRQTALLWMSRGDAEIPSFKRDTLITGELGVVIRGETIDPYIQQFNQTKLNPILINGEPHIGFEKTLCWNPKCHLRIELVAAGFGFLDTWEIAMPIHSYSELAVHIGGGEARARTQAVIRDLRVPLYDTRLMFIRHCESTVRLFEQWAKESEAGDDERLSFMRAFYQVKPLMLALPATWHDSRLYADAA